MGIIRTELYNLHQNTIAKIFALFAHPGRVKILMILLINERQTLGQIQELLGLSQAATSNQVQQMKDAGLVKSIQLETSVFYSLDRETWESIKRINQSFWDEVGNAELD